MRIVSRLMLCRGASAAFGLMLSGLFSDGSFAAAETAAAAPDSGGLDEIIVTAQRRT